MCSIGRRQGHGTCSPFLERSRRVALVEVEEPGVGTGGVGEG